MIFADLQPGAAVFVDANALIYHFTNHPEYGLACTAPVERIELKEILGVHVVAVSGRCRAPRHDNRGNGPLGWPLSRLAARLRNTM